jgi:pimeloyl-ACP methyl ester carboxylesterase
VPLHEIDVYQSMQRLERAGVDPATRSNARTLLGDLHAASRGEFDDVQGLRSRLEQTRAQSWARTLDLPETVPAPGSDRLRWAAVDFDPVRFFERLRVPVWLAFGERDERLPSAECAARLRAALERAGNSTVTLRMYPASNHALWPAPELERELSEWLRGRSRR